MLTVGIPGTSLDSGTRDILLNLAPGGVILFRRNIGASLDELRALLAELHALPSAPLISIDHEGGRVMRLPPPFTHFPAAAHVGRTGDPSLAEAVGFAMGRELRSIGIDISYAPVLDIHSNPANPVIGDRAFGSTPDRVCEMALAQMRGLQTAGVIPCGKHFPGHGDTQVDSHLELPVIERSRRELDRLELVPFRAAIAAGIPMLLTAHVVYKALDPDHPGTLSRRINIDLLRGELGFRGLLASDDLEMKAITGLQSIGAAAVAALNAGVDILLICLDLARGVESAAAIGEALRQGTLRESRCQEALHQIEAVRALRSEAVTHCALPNTEHQRLADRLSLA